VRVCLSLAFLIGLSGSAGIVIISGHPVYARFEQQAPATAERGAVEAMHFEVASLKQNTSKSNTASSNFNMDSTNSLDAKEDLFTITNRPLWAYIEFAYKLSPFQAESLTAKLPNWAKANRYDMQARAPHDATKDQIRLMMRDLLAARFQLALHFESQQNAALALVVRKPGALGPQLHQHLDNPPCDESPGASKFPFQTDPSGFPLVCGRVVPLRPKDKGRAAGAGGRSVTLAQIAESFLPGATGLAKPVVDETNLSGTFDFFIEWTPVPPAGVTLPPEMQNAPTFEEALQDQLGLKLKSVTVPLQVPVIDNLGQLTPN
jgi:bla regulator protein blaR1